MSSLPDSHRGGDLVRWGAFACWLVVAFLAPWHVATDTSSTAVAWTAALWGWTGWTVVTVALLVPSPPSLTALRITAPLAVVAAIAARDPLAIVVSIVVVCATVRPRLADRMAQGGAYGRETRFSLRTPVPHMAPAFVAWLLLAGPLVSGSLLLAARNVVAGAPMTLVGLVLCTRAPVRLHLLSRRWLVLVPAGIVVHDHLVLGETFMVRRSNVVSIDVVDAAGEAADLTGGTTGRRIILSLRRADKVILSDITARMLGTIGALHVQSFAVAPRRVDAALAALSI